MIALRWTPFLMMLVADAFPGGCCGGARYHGPPPVAPGTVTMPAATRGVVGSYVRLGPLVEKVPDGLGSGAFRGPLPKLSARCADEGLCDVKIDGAAALVGGRAPGATVVTISFTNPVTGAPVEGAVPVVFAAGRPVALEVGKPLANAALLHGVGGVDHMCFPAATPPQGEKVLDVGDIARGFAELRTCLPALELAPGRFYTPFAPSPTSDEPAVSVCLHHSMRDEQLVSLSVFRTPEGQPRALVEHRGPADPVCAPRR